MKLELNRLDDTYKRAGFGREIWLEIKKNYQINYSDLIIFYELENRRIAKCLEEIIGKEINKHKEKRVFLISAVKDTAINNVCGIYVRRDDYENLRFYYLITIFHSKVRFVSDKEPFGNLFALCKVCDCY